MLTSFPALMPRTLSPDAPACQPCPWPAPRPMSAPVSLPGRIAYSIADCSRARTRCQQVAQAHPSWPQSRVRVAVARELCVATTTLRYLLGRADAVLGTPDPEAPAALAA